MTIPQKFKHSPLTWTWLILPSPSALAPAVPTFKPASLRSPHQSNSHGKCDPSPPLWSFPLHFSRHGSISFVLCLCNFFSTELWLSQEKEFKAILSHLCILGKICIELCSSSINASWMETWIHEQKRGYFWCRSIITFSLIWKYCCLSACSCPPLSV